MPLAPQYPAVEVKSSRRSLEVCCAQSVPVKETLGKRCSPRLHNDVAVAAISLLKIFHLWNYTENNTEGKNMFSGAPDVTLYIKIKSPTLLGILNRLLVFPPCLAVFCGNSIAPFFLCPALEVPLPEWFIANIPTAGTKPLVSMRNRVRAFAEVSTRRRNRIKHEKRQY